MTCVTDPIGKKVDGNLVEVVETSGGHEVDVSDTYSVLVSMLKELKKMNIHLKSITDLDVQDRDVEV